MTPEQIIKRYSTLTEAAREIGVSKQLLYIWRKNKAIPAIEQIRIHKLTGGKLKADKEIIDAYSIQ